MLEFLILKKDQVVTRMEIIDHVWGEDIDEFSNIINMVISSLRKKLTTFYLQDMIRSVHGLGYKLSYEKF